MVVEIVEVTGTIETSYPKYITVRCNKNDAGKTSQSMGSCEYNHELEKLQNVSIDHVLVVRCRSFEMFESRTKMPFKIRNEYFERHETGFLSSCIRDRRPGDGVQFKFKGRGMQKFLIGQATVAIGDIVHDTATPQTQQLLSLPLVGAAASLVIRWTWEPVTQYSG